MLEVHLQRRTNTHHRLLLRRADGSQECAELETRSVLLHDLVHFAVEVAAGRHDGFFGRLAAGESYTALVDAAHADGAGAATMQIERVVGAMQGAWQRGADPVAAVTAFRGYAATTGEPAPSWLDEAVAVRAFALLRRLVGEWRATPFAAAMVLRFDPSGTEVG